MYLLLGFHTKRHLKTLLTSEYLHDGCTSSTNAQNDHVLTVYKTCAKVWLPIVLFSSFSCSFYLSHHYLFFYYFYSFSLSLSFSLYRYICSNERSSTTKVRKPYHTWKYLCVRYGNLYTLMSLLHIIFQMFLFRNTTP